MSELGNFLLDQIEKDGRSGQHKTKPTKATRFELAARLGIGASHLSQLVKGKRKSVNIETLNKIAVNISDDESVQAALLRAYFRDQTTSRRKDWIHVIPVSKKNRLIEEPPAYGKDPISALERLLRRDAVPVETVRAFHKIVSALPGHHSLQQLVKELGDFTEEAIHDGKGKKNITVRGDVLPPANSHPTAPGK